MSTSDHVKTERFSIGPFAFTSRSNVSESSNSHANYGTAHFDIATNMLTVPPD